jgi:hypothetical protein
MATIVTRAGKGSPLTNTEMDANLTNLNAVTPAGGGVAAAAGTNNDITGMTGLLTVPSIIRSAINALYPVGCIYSSTAAANPATIFGFGDWTAFGTGKVLIGQGAGWAAGSTGGSADAIVPSHTHGITDPQHSHAFASYMAVGGGLLASSATATNSTADTTTVSSTGITINATGVSVTDANLQPYIVVYMWNRTA